MIHRHAFRKLNRTASHRKALLRNLATNLVLHNRIVTTLPKAKELKRVADKLVTLGKKNTLHARREAMGFLYAINREADHNAQKWTAVHKLFTELAPKYSERNGGYVRVVKLGARLGDKAPMAVVEFVEGGSVEAKAPTKKRRQTKKSTPAASAEAVAE